MEARSDDQARATLLRYVARELADGTKERVLREELWRDYGYNETTASKLIAESRLALSNSPAIRGDEEIVSNLETRSRRAMGKMQVGLAVLVVAVAVALFSGRVIFPGWWPIILIGAGVVGSITWWRTRQLLRVHRAAARKDELVR